MTRISRAQIGAIHTLKGRAGLDDQSYRDMLMSKAGVSSAALLDARGAGAVILHLKSLSGQGSPRAATEISGPFGRKAQALWISAWHLGLTEKREDTALMAFVGRQTGIDHINWVREPRHGAAVIEALKAWLRRDAGVDWRQFSSPAACVVAAQRRALGEPQDVAALASAGDDDLKTAMQTLGAKLRKGRKSP